MFETFKVQKQSKELLTSTVFKDLGDIDRPTNLENLLANLSGMVFRYSVKKSYEINPITPIPGAMSTEVKIISQRATFFKKISTMILRRELAYAHRLIKNLFLSDQLPNVQVERRLKHFVKSRKPLTRIIKTLQKL